MLELLALIGLVLTGLALFAVLALVAGVLKLGFKLLALPLALAWGLVKLVLVCCLVLLGLVLAPVLVAVCLVVCLVALPLLLVAGAAGFCWAVVT